MADDDKKEARSEDAILDDLEAANTEYHEQADKLTPPEVAKLTKKQKDLRAELAAFYVQGCDPCPGCGNMPHGMRKNPGTIDIGCLHCKPKVDGDVTTQPRVQAARRSLAVKAWNAGERMQRKASEPVPEPKPEPAAAK